MDERAYDQLIKQRYLDQILDNLRSGLGQAEAATQAWRTLDNVIGAVEARPVAGVPIDAVRAHLMSLEGYHRARLIKTFSSALGVNIKPLLLEAPVAEFMANKVTENVDLIKTIPRRLHASLRSKLSAELAEAPFDQQRLRKLLSREFQSSGYNLRRLTRDQTSKTINGLTQIRHRGLGLDRYEWLTSGDERVRPTHAANDVLVFAWTDPPAATGHPGEDVQCRCVPVAVITAGQRARLGAPWPASAQAPITAKMKSAALSQPG